MLRKILPHGAIIISVMYFVFFFIDRVNSAMAFINNDITKVLLVILCVISIVNSIFIIADDRKKIRSRQRQAQQRSAVQPRPQPRQPQRYGDYPRREQRYAQPPRDYTRDYRRDSADRYR